ncbi:MAG: DivIVA domain-containing protein [candidate division Zixibacteria bacterium]|nr:DivIVA domain-containing protein [candidate division Zixibacteria bacterium]
MTLTAVDLRSIEFPKRFRGYDRAEVDSFLKTLADELEEKERELVLLRARTSRLEGELAEFRGLENSLQEVLMTAQKTAEDTRLNSIKEAELLLREAQLKAEELIAKTQESLGSVKRELVELHQLRANYVMQFRGMIDSHRAMLEELEKTQEGARYLRFVKKADAAEAQTFRAAEPIEELKQKLDE